MPHTMLASSDPIRAFWKNEYSNMLIGSSSHFLVISKPRQLTNAYTSSLSWSGRLMPLRCKLRHHPATSSSRMV